MTVQSLIEKVRNAVPESVWSVAVKQARDGGIRGISDDGEELCFHVKFRGKAQPFEVFLWPNEEDWGCDCTLPGPCCVHVCSAAIAWIREVKEGGTLPQPKKKFQVKLRYDFVSEGSALHLKRTALYPDGREELLKGTLAESDLLADRGDVQVESLLAMHVSGPLSAVLLRKVLVFLEGKPTATLDGKKIKLSAKAISFQIVVQDHEEGFKAALGRPSGIQRLFRGAAVKNRRLRPTSHGSLTQEQRRELMKGVFIRSSQVGRLVQEMIPVWRSQIDVEIRTERLPHTEQLQPYVAVTLKEAALGLMVEAWVLYGDPAVARVERGMLKLLGEVIPARDPGSERLAVREYEALTGLVVGHPHTLPPSKAAGFLTEVLPKFSGKVIGKIPHERFAIESTRLLPKFQIQEGDSRRWQLDVDFVSDTGRHADTDSLLTAWKSGSGLVPLLGGGFAPLPSEWLAKHGSLLRELWEQRDKEGQVHRHCAAAISELFEENEELVPPDLKRLRDFLEQGEGLPSLPISKGFTGELRGYQQVGVDWIRFMGSMDLNGILADDMGLGKTLQALIAIASAEGQTLVVAPTSVLKNWFLEAQRFLPDLTVNVYHGPKRSLDDARLTLTSYALLRLDRAKFSEIPWTYLVLDEAQFIKNPQSQTARAACSIESKHRLALTGTPVENRLEELWSQFHFLMPGLLGRLDRFKENFVKPIDVGDKGASARLRNRIRPYVLRRLKRQVAKELPQMTEMVVRCDMLPDQRAVYELIRETARRDLAQQMGVGFQGKSTMQVLEALLRLRQACCDPGLLPGEQGKDIGSGKLDQLESLLVELICGGHKALVFSQWTSLLDRVEIRLKELGIDWVRLDGATRDRQGVVDSFQDPDGPPVFLLSLKAGGTGLNLTAADYVLLLDPWWNPAVERQAADRAHRIGQTRPVVCCRFISSGTVEERILELQEAKRGLADAAIGAEGGFIRHLSSDELRSLFDGVN